MAEYKIIRKANKERKKANKRRLINTDIIRIAIFFAALFFVLIVFLVKFMAVDSSSVINNTYNKRSDSLKKSVIRGSILSGNGEKLAYSVFDENGNEVRLYPYGNTFAHVVGFDSYGGLGLESSYNYYLLTSHTNIFNKIADEFKNEKAAADSVKTTLDPQLQKKLTEILGENEGAIIVIDPDSGEIPGMVSYPTFDPENPSEIIENDESDSSALLNRATQATLTPGSSFKLFTLLEYYRQNGGKTNDFLCECGGYMTLQDETFGCPFGEAHGSQNLKTSFANSCNIAFSNIGLSLDIDKFTEDLDSLLFNTDLGIDIASKMSSFELSSSDNDFMIAQTAFGQGKTLVSPLHMAMIACAAANNGTVMKPHLVTEVIDSTGKTVEQFSPEVYAQLFSSEEADFLREYMRAVVTDGTARLLSYDGNYISYGKTGTAETRSNEEENHDHSWFTGFAENNGKKLVVCAMIENAQESGLTGLYPSKQVFDYYFN